MKKLLRTFSRSLLSLPLLTSVMTVSAEASTLPKGTVLRPDTRLGVDGLEKGQFDAIIDKIENLYRPIFGKLGATLVVDRLWESEEANAFAFKNGSEWHVELHGGLARRSEVTLDAYALVICHEVGHHLGGFPFTFSGMSNEGQSDFYATHTCAPIIWGDEKEKNAEFRSISPETVIKSCNIAWDDRDRRNLCYRTAVAGKSVSDFFAANSGTTTYFDKKEQNKVSQTINFHPQAQCRLDTYVEGALCVVPPEVNYIPGKNNPSGANSVAAEIESAAYTCSQRSELMYGFDLNGHFRPGCWYKESLSTF